MVFIVVYIILFNFGETEADCLLPCPKYHNSFNCNFYNSTCFTHNESVSLNITNKMMPARPENLQTKFFDNANITFTWNADTSTIERLQGFLLNLTVVHGLCKVGRNHFVRVFTYPNISQIEKYKNEQFSLEVNSLCAANWELELYSLPKGNCSKNVQRQILILPHRSNGNNASGSWQSSMTITYTYPLRNIEVNFTKAPKYFNFEKYNISLEKNNEIVDSRIIKKITEPSVTFEVDTSGKYVVKLQPFSNDENRCVCRTKENKCKLCEVTSSHKIEFTDICPKNSTPEPDNITYLIIVGVIVAIIFILLIVIYFFCKSSKKLPKKYALLLCLNDHLLHDEAVQLLIKYLEDFGVIVHHANKFGKCVFEVYDIVLLINSTALAERQKAWAEGKDYEQFFMEEHSSKLTNETFILIDELSLAKDRHKIISFKFDHTPDSPVFKHYPSQNGNFSIPRNLFDMVKSMVDVSIKFRGFFKKQKLLNAISNAAEYEKCNKNWFSEKYGDPIPENFISCLNSKDRKSMKKNNNNFNTDYSINSSSVSELLHTLQKKNDQEMLFNFLNMNNIENSSILNV